MYMDDIKLFAENEKSIINPKTNRLYNLDIGMRFGIEKCAMLIMKTGNE